MAADVSDFMQEHGFGTAALIGHSMGAKVAMTLALRAPNLVRSLIPVDNAPVSTKLGPEFYTYIRGFQAIETANVTRQVDADRILKEYEDNLAIRQFLLTNLVKTPDSGVLRFRVPLGILGSSLDSMGDFPFRQQDEARYTGPTLFIRSTRSHYVTDKHLPLIGHLFPNFEVCDIDSGHWVISEKPQDFLQAVVQFIKRHVDAIS